MKGGRSRDTGGITGGLTEACQAVGDEVFSSKGGVIA